MRLKFFSLTNLTLLVALSLSAVAAFYSIIGLTAIFAGAVIPVIVMGCILEVSKLTTTVWLRTYWDRVSLLMKMYLVPAVIILALITSLGIFGLLSKAHIDQGVSGGDVSAKIALIDEKVKTQRENIKASREALAQMDLQVNNVIVKGDTEKSAERSVQIRRQQSKERGILVKEIEAANKEIGKLNEERAPIASQVRKAEAEVGPIKYLAAMIYGDNLDASLLEKAVRWVIILLVLVFDPLAIAMLLASNQSRDWDREDEAIGPKPDDPIQDIKIEESNDIKVEEQYNDTISPEEAAMFGRDEPGPIERTVYEPDPQEFIETASPDEHEEVHTTLDVPAAPNLYASEYVTYQGKHIHRDALKALHPELFLTTTTVRQVSTNFGISFPATAGLGDIFVRVDMLPNKVFKFEGTKWIEINKDNTTTYLNQPYLKHLVSKIDSGEYDVEMLSEQEKIQIEEYLKDTKSV